MEILQVEIFSAYIIFACFVVAALAFLVFLFLVTSAFKIWFYPEDKFFILYVLNESTKPMTFHEVIREGRKQFGYQGSIHRFREQIGRMEDGGFVSSFKRGDGHGDIERGGRPLVFFEITESGFAELNRLIADEVIIEFAA